jgi:cysteinyl-tRNA synthetase
MAAALLGEEIDLHSGGEDNIFPHHECEIAQTCSDTERDSFARFWFHTRHLIVEGEKMSKSKGNFFTVRDLLAKGASPAAIRLEIIKTHYRSNANFTFQGLADSQRMIDRWTRLRNWLQSHGSKTPASSAPGPLAQAMPAFEAALSADVNIAGSIGVLNEAAGQYNLAQPPPAVNIADELAALQKMNSVLGVLDLETTGSNSGGGLDVPMVEDKIAQRNAARKAKDFARSDQLRDELLAMGVEIKDGAQGTAWTRVVK